MNSIRLYLSSLGVVLATLSLMPFSALGGVVSQPSFDVDGDGTVAPADILALVDHMRQLPPASRSAQFDLNDSGAVDESDVASLVQRLRLQAGQSTIIGRAAGMRAPQDGRSAFLGQTAGGPPLTSYTLVPQTPGPYAPNSSVDVDVVLTNNEGQAIQPRLITLDFSATDAAPSLPPLFQFQLVPPLVSDSSYVRLENLPRVDIIYTEGSPAPGLILDIPDGGTLLLGTITVDLPAVGGVYVLDVINPGAPDTNAGGRLDYGFESPRTTLHTLNQNLAGSPLVLMVGPLIPATSYWGLGVMLLLAACVGTTVFTRRQRNAA